MYFKSASIVVLLHFNIILSTAPMSKFLKMSVILFGSKFGPESEEDKFPNIRNWKFCSYIS
jgi:hypothetical protein